ncbi:hypothetical protein IRJ41_007989 [Triplophysa rosa]|uniref:Uncharacterized protein n=1 Tax=Triplophysa rosa TaxID=992332 RepID=A0A9W7WNH2_TRIRA|nr:hypothetical protein IRJ41_007989 [Triplophysa rosa]
MKHPNREIIVGNSDSALLDRGFTNIPDLQTAGTGPPRTLAGHWPVIRGTEGKPYPGRSRVCSRVQPWFP